MLRCAGCGGLVSEFAARCPACRQSTDNADEVDEVDHPPEGVLPEVPAVCAQGGTVLGSTGSTLDPIRSIPAHSRTPRPTFRRSRKTLRAVIAAAVVAGIAVAATSWLARVAGPLRAASPSLSGLARDGWIVAESADGTVVVSDPDGSSLQALRTFPLQTGSSDQQLVAAADERFLMSGIHTLITATGAFPTPIDSNVLFTPAMTPVRASPFADGDRAVVVRTGGSAATSSAISLVLLADGATLALGEGQQAAGDPQSLGAFVAVAAPAQGQGHSWHSTPVDVAVEFRTPGRSQLLATSAGLNRALAQNPARPVTLFVVPDSAGDKLAVLTEPAGGTGGDVGLVVLDRRGRVLGALDEAAGPARDSMPSWAPDGSALVYYTVTRRGAALALWPIGGHAFLRVAPNPKAIFDACLWAPDNSMVLCSTASEAPQWIFGRTNGGRLAAITAPTFLRGFAQPLRPVAWLPGPSPVRGSSLGGAAP